MDASSISYPSTNPDEALPRSTNPRIVCFAGCRLSSSLRASQSSSSRTSSVVSRVLFPQLLNGRKKSSRRILRPDFSSLCSSTFRHEVRPSPKPRKRGNGAFSKSTSQPKAQVDAAPSTAEVQTRVRLVIIPGSKRAMTEEPQGPSSVEGSSQQPRRLDKRKGVEVAADLGVPLMSEGPLMMPGSKINDPQFLIPNMVDHNLKRALHLRSRFNLPIQAIYSHFHPDS